MVSIKLSPYLIFTNKFAKPNKNRIFAVIIPNDIFMMKTSTYNGSIGDLWHYLQGLSLSATDSLWLAEKLAQNAQKKEKTEKKKLVFPHIDDGIKPSEELLSMVLGAAPDGFDIDKELELMWEERAK
ncbi:MAG: hypothetical protein IJR13_02755 [Bacteroidales bacterium]|nr:hypothetical protein [Bacteroidales bacterium]